SISMTRLRVRRVQVLDLFEEPLPYREGSSGNERLTLEREEHEFVDLCLQLELERGGGQVHASALGHVHEMTDAFDDLQVRVARVVVVGVGREDQRELDAVPGVADEQRLARGRSRSGPHEVGDVGTALELVEAFEGPLHAAREL